MSTFDMTFGEKNYTLDEVLKIAEGMKSFGGSFVKNLGVTLSSADVENTNKILNTWSDKCEKYLELGS